MQEEPKKIPSSIERQKFQMEKNGLEGIKKSIDNLKNTDTIKKVQLVGPKVITIKGKDGVDGINGKDGKDSFVPGPKGKDGKDGKDGKNGLDGKDGINGKDGKYGLKGKDGLNGKVGKDGSPDSPEDIVSKLQTVRKEWLDINAIKGDFNSRVSMRGGKMASVATSLKQLTDVDYSGLSQDAQGNFILGSGGGGGAWGSGNIEGGNAGSIYLMEQFINGGEA